jgi:hypothetical protein
MAAFGFSTTTIAFGFTMGTGSVVCPVTSRKTARFVFRARTIFAHPTGIK